MALSYAFDTSQGETPQSITNKRELANQLAARIFGKAPANVGEGLNAIGQAFIARQMMGEATDAQKAGLASGTDAFSQITGGGGIATQPPPTDTTAAPIAPTATPPMGDVAPLTSAPAAPSTEGKIYSNDEASPLDPPSGQDRARMIATILGEAGNESQLGKNAVASVIRTRAVDGGYGGDTPSSVVTAPNQFEPWNTQVGRDRMSRAAANPQLASQADAAISSAYGEGGKAPNDPTEGMTHFFSPSGQAAMGRTAPAWAGGESMTIGNHVFNSPDDAKTAVPTQVASNDQSSIPINAQPTQGTLPPSTAPQPTVTPSSGPTTQQLMQAASNPWLNEGQRTVVQTMLKQRLETEQQGNDPLRQLQIKKAQQDLDKPDQTFSVIGQDPATGKSQYGFINPKTGEVTPYSPPASVTQGTGLQAAIQNGVTGDDLYAHLPKDRAATVKGMIEGRIPPPSISARSSPESIGLLNAASSIDPDFDATTWKARSTYHAQFGSQAPSSIGGQKTLMSTSLGHLSEVADSAARLANTDGMGIAKAGHFANAVKNQTTEQAAIANALNDKVAKFSGEVGKLYSGSQGGGVHEREDTRERLGSNLTSAELASGLEASRDLIVSKQKALEDQAVQIFGADKAKKFDFAGPEGRAAMEKIDASIQKLRGKNVGDSPTAPTAAAPQIDPAALAEAKRRGLIQ